MPNVIEKTSSMMRIVTIRVFLIRMVREMIGIVTMRVMIQLMNGRTKVTIHYPYQVTIQSCRGMKSLCTTHG